MACLLGTARTNIGITTAKLVEGYLSRNVQVPSMYSTRIIQMAKKPAIIATTAATPPFANREVAGDEVVGDEAAELADEALVGTEVMDVPVEVPSTGVDPLAEVMEDPAALDATDEAPLEVPVTVLGGVVYGIELGVPVAVGAGNEVHSADCKATAAGRSVGQCI
jgi:hypothetical protein